MRTFYVLCGECGQTYGYKHEDTPYCCGLCGSENIEVWAKIKFLKKGDVRIDRPKDT